MSQPSFARSLQEPTSFTLLGTFPSNNSSTTTNTSVNSAKALYQFLQVFLGDFPEHNTSDKRISLWTESYGGQYGPVTAGLILRQNRKIANEVSSKYRNINLDSLGIISGCIDTLVEKTTQALFAFNNTYGEQLINQAMYNRAVALWPQCQKVVRKCQQLSEKSDREQVGARAEVNSACQDVLFACSPVMQSGVGDDRSMYDIAAPMQGE
jgi:carboxypeptidase C (cathepsin A)